MNDPVRTTDAGEREYGIAPRGYRLPAETVLGPVRLQVTDLDRSAEYYQRVLGFRVTGRDGGGATLAARGDDRALIELRENRDAVPVRVHGRLGLYHFAILLPTRADLGRYLQHLSAIGERAGAADHFVSEALYLRDPDGLGIEVYADRPRSAWKAEGRELRMETAPLNAADLLRASGAAAWAGMPAGTTIGHVHLHVGEIDQAAAFYHEALGLDKVVWSYPGALFLSAGGYHHHLGLNVWAAGAPPAGDGDAKLLEWTLVLPDAAGVAAGRESLTRGGYTAERAPDETVVTRDPWGTQLRLRAGAAAGEEDR